MSRRRERKDGRRRRMRRRRMRGRQETNEGSIDVVVRRRMTSHLEPTMGDVCHCRSDMYDVTSRTNG